MKQVLFVGAGRDFPSGAFNFLRFMEGQERVHARGLFFRPPGITPTEILNDHKSRFAELCGKHHIRYDVHENDGDWAEDFLIRESRFADLILVSGEECHGGAESDQPTEFLREALLESECPVLIVPEDYSLVQHLFMAYDGSEDSMYAIKQFCNLFPQLIDLPVEIIYIDGGAVVDIPHIESLKRYTRLKFDYMSFSKLHLKAADYFAEWINGKKHVLLVTGSFGRPTTSYIERPSFMQKVLQDHKLPVFVAHH